MTGTLGPSNQEPDFIPLAERLKIYAQRDEAEAAAAKVVQLIPPA
jgi:hypothetical protein